jgi:LMBR1 domain-containing protein 1
VLLSVQGSLKYQFFHLKVIFVFSWIYVRYYQDHLESEMSTTITAIIALTITLITSAMVPLDIFLVSYMKTSDGTFKVMQ